MKFLKDAYITALKVRFEVGMRTMGGLGEAEAAKWAAYFVAGGPALFFVTIFFFVDYMVGIAASSGETALFIFFCCACVAIYLGNQSLLKSIGYEQIRKEFSEKKTVSMFADAPLMSWAVTTNVAVFIWLLWIS